MFMVINDFDFEAKLDFSFASLQQLKTGVIQYKMVHNYRLFLQKLSINN